MTSTNFTTTVLFWKYESCRWGSYAELPKTQKKTMSACPYVCVQIYGMVIRNQFFNIFSPQKLS